MAMMLVNKSDKPWFTLLIVVPVLEWKTVSVSSNGTRNVGLRTENLLVGAMLTPAPQCFDLFFGLEIAHRTNVVVLFS